MTRLIALLLSLPIYAAAAAAAAAEPYCKRLPFDAETPPGLTGEYEIVGKDAPTGRAYAGTLQIALHEHVYVLTRTVQGQSLRGEAWAESCSPDKFLRLVARYEATPKPIELSCYLRFDGDNYTRASCTSADGRGLEAWFQSHESAP